MNSHRQTRAAVAGVAFLLIGAFAALAAEPASSAVSPHSIASASASTCPARVRAEPSRTEAVDPFASERALLKRAASAGWHLTDAGKQIVQGANPSDPSLADLASRSAGDDLTGAILAVSDNANAVVPAQAPRTLQSAARTTGATTVWMGCNYGQSGGVTYETTYGFTWADWKQHSIDGRNQTLESPTDFCGYNECIAQSQDTNVGNGWQTTFAVENAQYSVPIPQTETCF